MGLPFIPRAASIIASDIVGWAWIILSISSGSNSECFANKSSCNNSVAQWPTIWAPNISSVCTSQMILTKPSGLPTAIVLPAPA